MSSATSAVSSSEVPTASPAMATKVRVVRSLISSALSSCFMPPSP